MSEKSPTAERYELLEWVLDERQRRMFVAAEAKVLGRGGVSAVAKATGVSRETVRAGLAELDAARSSEGGAGVLAGVRRAGGGRKRAVEKDATLLRDLESLVDPVTRGDPESPLRWTCKSLRTLAAELRNRGHTVSHVVVGTLLKALGYSLQANTKTLEGGGHPDRNAQFEHINACTGTALAVGEPVISGQIPRKRNWLACTKTMAGSGKRKANRLR